MISQKSTLILGIGNILMGDEGVGVHLANALQNEKLPPDVTVIDGGTGGFHLLEFFETHDHVIMVDATLDDNNIGTIRLIKPRFASDFPPAMSTHDIGLRDLVTTLQLLDKMPEIDLFVVSIKSLQQQSISLSPEVQNSLPHLKEQIFALIEEKRKIIT